MQAQGQRLNLKWTMADVDRVVARARAGKSAVEISESLKGRIDCTPEEIIDICEQSYVFVPRSRVRAAR